MVSPVQFFFFCACAAHLHVKVTREQHTVPKVSQQLSEQNRSDKSGKAVTPICLSGTTETVSHLCRRDNRDLGSTCTDSSMTESTEGRSPLVMSNNMLHTHTRVVVVGVRASKRTNDDRAVRISAQPLSDPRCVTDRLLLSGESSGMVNKSVTVQYAKKRSNINQQEERLPCLCPPSTNTTPEVL